MEEKRKIRMPIGAAVACLLIVALLTVGIVAGAKFINNSLSASQTEKDASAQATSAPSGSNGTVGSSGDKTGDLPSDKLSYAGSSARPDSEYKTFENCMSSVVSIDVTAQSGHKSVLAGSGSGVIISADGYIVTCNHVVEGAQKIFVYLDNGNDYEATLVGTDSVTDLAVIKINAYNLNYAKFGDSSTLSVGEDVFAIGNALGQLSNTYTRGSISGLDRSITIDNVTMTLLQTDAAINQGNSGGGLFRESDGTLIGIVNAKSSGSGIEGLGFAIPSTLAREVIGSLMDYGFVVGRPYLGVSTQDVSLSGYGFFTSAYTYPCIVSVEDGSAAQQAGLKKDDVIMAVNGETVSSSDGLYIAVSKFKVGDTVTLTILRSNSQIDVSVTLGQRSTAKTAE